MLCVVLFVALGVAGAIDEDHSNDVLLIPSKTECDKGEKITVAYQRVANERDPQEASDFIGLFRKQDATALSPYDVVIIGKVSQTGEVTLTCRRSGEMEVRIVRVPGQIYGKAPIVVYTSCPSRDCSGHGTCQKGECSCVDGWDGDSCELLSGEGMTIGWLNNPKGEFYPGDEIQVKISHASTEAESSGLDYVSIFPFTGTSDALATSYIRQGESETTLQVPEQKGKFTLHLTRGADQTVIATSLPFTVYGPCPLSCSFRGVCQEGKCKCDAGFDREDCSRGPGIVTVAVLEDAYIGTPLNVSFTRDETSGALSDRDWIGLYKDTDESCDNPEYFAYAIADRVYDPDVKATLDNPNITNGHVQLMVPVEPGKYIVRYVRQDHAKYATTTAFEAYHTCPARCSGRGKCVKGVCVCEGKWTGADCTEGIADFSLELVGVKPDTELHRDAPIKVKFGRPAGGNTSNYDFIGLYAADSANNTDKLYQYAYAISMDKDAPEQTGTVDLVLSIAGSLMVRYVNAYTLETNVELDSAVTVYDDCPADCSGHGTCAKGVCTCEAKWKGDDCSKGVGDIEMAPTNGSPVGLLKSDIGFSVHVKRPANHFAPGDFVALFPVGGPYEVDKRKAYAYAKPQDDSDVFLILSADLLATLRRGETGQFVLKYFSASQQEMATSDEFGIELATPVAV